MKTLKNYFTLVAVLLLSISACAQSFTIDVSPAINSVTQNIPLNLTITGLPSGGYNASIQVSIVSSCFATSDISLTPTFLNPPYNGQIQVSNFDRYVPGNYYIVIKGENGSVVSYDTVNITIQPVVTSEWYHYNLGKFGFTGYYYINDVKIDSHNNYWFSVNGQVADDGGLVKYTGHSLETWRNNVHYVYDLCGTLQSSNADSVIQFYAHPICMEIDAQDNIWFYEKTFRRITQYSPTLGVLYRSPQLNFATIPSTMRMLPVDFATRKFYFASNAGLIYLDNTTVTQYTTSNSAIPSNACNALLFDNSGVLWITTSGGLAKFQGGFWTVYTTSNSAIGSNSLGSLLLDDQGDLVFGGANGINKFSSNIFSVIIPGLPLNGLTYDHDKTLWGATYFGLRSIDSSMNITVYDSVNTLHYITYDSPNLISVDYNNNLVVSAFHSTPGVQYSEFMIRNPRYVAPIGIKDNRVVKNELEIYPNPAQNKIKLKGLSKGSYLLKLYDFRGLEIQKENIKYEGEEQEIILKSTALPAGIYFLQLSDNLRLYSKKLIIE